MTTPYVRTILLIDELTRGSDFRGHFITEAKALSVIMINHNMHIILDLRNIAVGSFHLISQSYRNRRKPSIAPIRSDVRVVTTKADSRFEASATILHKGMSIGADLGL